MIVLLNHVACSLHLMVRASMLVNHHAVREKY